jgi:hypothetical protein
MEKLRDRSMVFYCDKKGGLEWHNILTSKTDVAMTIFKISNNPIYLLSLM